MRTQFVEVQDQYKPFGYQISVESRKKCAIDGVRVNFWDTAKRNAHLN